MWFLSWVACESVAWLIRDKVKRVGVGMRRGSLILREGGRKESKEEEVKSQKTH